MSTERALTMIDARDYALILTVDKSGIANMHAEGVGHAQAAEWMRMMLDTFEHQHGLSPDGSFAANEIAALRKLVRRLANNEKLDADETALLAAALR